MNLSSKKDIGRFGEDIAAAYLEGKGYKIIARNYWKPWGELDLIALKSGLVRFIEVKSAITRDSEVGDSYRLEDKVHPEKLKRMHRAIESYLTEKDIKDEWTIDVVTVSLNPSEKTAQCELIENVL